MPPSGASARERTTADTRRRIAETALDLFERQGYAETTIDQIARAAGVGRRTIFRHFPTKEAILLDHLAVRREDTLAKLRARPTDEPLIVSLHTVLRELAGQGYDRRLLTQIRAVLTADPRLAREELSVGGLQFEKKLVEALRSRDGETRSELEILAVAFMAANWFTTAIHLYFIESRTSLLQAYDEVVAACAAEAGRLAAP